MLVRLIAISTGVNHVLVRQDEDDEGRTFPDRSDAVLHLKIPISLP